MPGRAYLFETQRRIGLLALVSALLLAGCHQEKCDRDASVPLPAGAGADAGVAIKIEDPRLDNAHRLTGKVYAGGQPRDAAAFQALKELGIKTILSVDGATPDVAGAHRVGLTYVHLPFGYDGIPQERAEAVAKAIDDLPGPIYIHCHHGMHRGAAAAAVGCIIAGKLTNQQALAAMKVFGTGENYLGLWAAARNARPVDPEALKKLNIVYQEVAPIPPLADAMVQIDNLSDNLKSCQAVGWTTPKTHPDLDPAHEALKLRETMFEVMRTDDFAKRPDDFKAWMKNGEKLAGELEDRLRARAKDQASTDSKASDAIDGALLQIQNNCNACHTVYRNVPQK
jgi:protein tyrosine phosphatase (PTP) superfamily phosphohydrolase (DUF442 family)